jgi:cardiolipin synthase A/B
LSDPSSADLWLIGLLFGIIVLLVIAVWSVKRHRDPHLFVECDAPIGELIPSISGLSLGMPVAGNAVEIFQNGAFFDALIGDIASARHTVHFETFLWKEGALGQRMADAFCERARAGVKVRLLLDANGCKKMGKSVRRQLRDCGCDLALYHPRTLANIGVVMERDHRKLAVIDGRIAWIGGHCIVDEWLGDGQDRQHVRDLSARLRGPIVHAVQSIFSENWIEVTGCLFAGDDVFPELENAGSILAHAASVKPEGSAPAVKLLHSMAILCARERILIQNPYFIPKPEIIGALARAVERGVEVKVMVPSAEASDMGIVQHAAHRNFQRLLESGVRIFEYHRTLLHQKVMTVDGVWSAIGSSNFDDRSLETNDELTLGFYDAGLARRMEEIFEGDLPYCVELEAAEWRKRGAGHRLLDSTCYLFSEVL